MTLQAYQYSGGSGTVLVPSAPIQSPRDPISGVDIISPSGNPYQLLQGWRNTVTGSVFEFLGRGIWAEVSQGTGGPVTTLTGNSGGAVSPVAGNINIVGNSLVNILGSGNTLTATATASGYPVTPFVVGPVGQAGYQTIQSAVTAAIAAGGATIYIQGGTYTENLTLTGGGSVSFYGEDQGVTIIGVHTPPTSGTITFDNIVFVSATHVLNSAAAGTTSINFNNCFFVITNGFIFNLLNWTGELLMDNCGEASTNDGVVNNTGGSQIKFINVEMGAGSGQTMTLTGNGNVRFDTCNINCPINIAGTGTFIFQNGLAIKNTLTIGGSKTGSINDTVFLTGAIQPLIYNSSGACSLNEVTIDSSAATVISGTGTLNYGQLTFRNSSTVSGVVLTATGSQRSGPITVNGNLIFGISGNKISTSVATTTAAGANSFGSVTLTGGTATVSTTSVTASSLIKTWRQSIGATGAAATGNITIGTIVAATSFVINSVSAANATALAATDVSVIGWEIIN